MTVVGAATVPVDTMKLALLAPAGTVTLAGTAAAPALLLERETTAPPAGAGALRVIVPVEDCAPPITLVGFKASAETVVGVEDAEPCSKVQTAGFASFSGMAMNFDGETT